MDEFEASRLTIPEIANDVEKRIILDADNVYAANNMMNLLHEQSSLCENDVVYCKTLQDEEDSLYKKEDDPIHIKEKRFDEMIARLNREALGRWQLITTIFLICAIIAFLCGYPFVSVLYFIVVPIIDYILYTSMRKRVKKKTINR